MTIKTVRNTGILIGFFGVLVVGNLMIHKAFATCSITVINTNDSGAGSLRAAIDTANGNGSSVDTICFAIPGGPYQTISPSSALPAIGFPVIIDGTSQQVGSTVPLIEINGAGAGASVSGIVINAGSSVVKGLIVNRFGGDG